MTQPLRIMLVDDDASICTVLMETLEAMEHRVCGIEATEAGAVEAALRTRPDLMIADVNLAAGSGIAAAAAISRVAAVRVIFISGVLNPPVPADAITLRKPFRHRDLVVTIDGAISVGQACQDTAL